MVQIGSFPSIPNPRAQDKKREDSSESVSSIQENQRGSNSRFIPKEIKQKFIDLITNRNYSMKQAAKVVNMSYSTAKKIYRRFRTSINTRHAAKVPQGTLIASYREISQESHTPMPGICVVCLIAGNWQNCQQFHS